ncbi:DUF5462 family protein [Vibrio navarrensis]|uniref:DUF5462 family protein n=1 Tax=Vibrio navarrensis TaxID=29495 RepID=UPI001558C79A|nr:DUF5462 family protein [Vibrio navarrensis]
MNLAKNLYVIIVFALIFNFSNAAASIYYTVHEESLGIVNGKSIGETVEIERILTNPTLLSLKKEDLKGELTTVIIKDAFLIENNSMSEMSIRSVQSAMDKVTSYFKASLWIDGNIVPIKAEQVSNAVNIHVPNSFKLIEIKATSPIKIVVPKDLRGDMKVNLVFQGN